MSFRKDVRDLKAAIQANVDAGRGNRSLIEAVEAMRDRPPEEPPPTKKPRKKRSLLGTAALSALFGAIWQSTRR